MELLLDGGSHTGAVQITGTNPTVDELKVINNATDGTISLPNASASFSGSAASLADALSGGSFTGDISIDDDPNPTQLKTINDATTGTITLDDYNISLSEQLLLLQMLWLVILQAPLLVT